MSIPQGFLSFDHRVLVKIYYQCVRHEAHHSMLTKANPHFFFAMGSRKGVDL